VLAGFLVGAATLQKLTGALLPAAFALALLAERRPLRRVFARTAVLAGPCAVAVVIYGTRNYFVHGSFGFRFSALDWLSKLHYPTYFAYFEHPLSTWHVLTSIGLPSVGKLVAHQFSELSKAVAGTDTMPSMFLLVIGPPALLLCLKQHRRFAITGLIYSAIVVVAVCVLYHVEPRYFSGLVPVFSVAVAGAVTALFTRLLSRVPARSVQHVRLATAVLAASVAALFAFRLAVSGDVVRRLALRPHACKAAFDFVSREAAPSDRVMSSDPWAVAWVTKRAAVVAPTNGPLAIATVARHYGVKWALMDVVPSPANDTFARLAGRWESGLPRVQRVFRGGTCSVYTLAP
jgi:hypothetical protein